MTTPARRARFIAEYGAVGPALFLLDRLPFGAAAAIGRSIADAWYACDRKRRKTAIGNIELSGIASDRAEAREIARASFRHMAMVVVESLKSSFTVEQKAPEGIDLQIPPATMEALRDPGMGVILASGHIGNWEVAAQALSGIKPVTGITRRMNNPYVNRLMERRKPRNRFELTPKHDNDKGRFLSVLRRGEILALLTDQHARDRGMMIDFFGRGASTHTSPALLHLVTRAPICFGYCIRTNPMKFKMIADEPLRFEPSGNREADTREILTTIAGKLESAIRAYPDQYLWAHRRWRQS